MIKTFRIGKWSLLIIFLIISFILYFPVLDKGFVSDDFTVLYRLISAKDFTPPGFFRPGADFSLYSTWLFSGLNSTLFNVTNLLIHVLNAWLIYLVCGKFFFLKAGGDSSLPVIVSIIFLFYPFHQEPIVWVLGRGILLSSFFSLLSLYVLLTVKNNALSSLVAAALYFLSLACYESGIFIPVIAFLILRRQSEMNKVIWAMVLFGVALAVHFLLRIYYSGSVIGVYGKELNAFAPVSFLYEYIKLWLRLVMGPLKNVYLFTGFALLILSGLVYSGYKIAKKDQFIKPVIIGLVLILVISFLIPAFFGLSIRTSEGDRLLYFPSIFYSVYLGLMFTYLIKRYRYVFILYTVVCILLIQSGNKEWMAASKKVQQIISLVKDHAGERIIIYNLPGSKNGKYIFRNGFREALYLNKIDTTGIYINNLVEYGMEGKDQIVQPPVQRNDKNKYRLFEKIPFNLHPPYTIINISDRKINVYKVGY